MLGFIGLWSHALAALLFGILAVWQLRNWSHDAANRRLAAAFAITAVWAIFVAFRGSHSMAAGLAEAGRNFAFLGFLYAMVRSASDPTRHQPVRVVYAVVGGVIGFQLTIAAILPQFEHAPRTYQALTETAQMLGLAIAAGGLILVHNLYGQAAPDSRWAIRLPMIALASMWAYDLHLYTIGYLSREPVDDLLALRGAALAAVAPLFAVGSRRNADWRMQVSRAATFQSLSLVAILGYLMLMMSATRALEAFEGQWLRIGQVGLIFLMTIAAMLVFPSGRMRAWLRVIMAKHFFEHRYDYREEWLRFTRTVAVAGADAPPIAERVVKAIAEIAGSPSGLLLVADESGRLAVEARWNWSGQQPHAGAGERELVQFLERTGHVIDFEAARRGTSILPSEFARAAEAWAGVPLLHNDRLVGLVILAHPLVRRALDWEDFDLFRTAGLQAASYLAEARTQEALANAQRFDEFNRRFAFILHDIKNLVSQLSLVARNAERHAENPAFRADMIATLQSSVRKMNDLLARLSNGRNGGGEAPRPTGVGQVVESLAQVKRRVHQVETDVEPGLVALIDPQGLEQALGHLVQNAIDASPAGVPVTVCVRTSGGDVAIEVADRGAGMSAEFVRSRLFQPFASTKDNGFGVGAFEARSLIAAMGGRLDVESREGEGTRFTVFLPLASTSNAFSDQRMCA